MFTLEQFAWSIDKVQRRSRELASEANDGMNFLNKIKCDVFSLVETTEQLLIENLSKSNPLMCPGCKKPFKKVLKFDPRKRSTCKRCKSKFFNKDTIQTAKGEKKEYIWVNTGWVSVRDIVRLAGMMKKVSK